MKNSKFLVITIMLILGFTLSSEKARAQDAGENLIINPGLEEVDLSGAPVGWQTNYWGENQPIFTYPVPGRGGGQGAQVEIISHTSGDAKWYFDDVIVVSGADYVFEDYYKSNVASEVDIRYTFADGSFGYDWLGNLDPASDWTHFRATFSIPENVVSITIFHILFSAGNLVIDDAMLVKDSSGIPDPDQLSEGLVTFSFDDSWYSQYVNAVPLLGQAGVNATFYVVTANSLSEQNLPPVSVSNLIRNPSLEDEVEGNPEFWVTNSWGENTSEFEYPVPGRIAGSKAAKTTITSHSLGDAKWHFDEVGVVGGESYIFSDWYRSGTTSEIVLRYTMTDDTYDYVWTENLPPAIDWSRHETELIIPENVKGLIVFHLISGVGTLEVDDFSLVGPPVDNHVNRSFMNPNELLLLSGDGHEIANHTRTHDHLTLIEPSHALIEIEGGRDDIISMGLSTPLSFAYPYGEYNDLVKMMVNESGHIGARGVERGFNNLASDLYALKIQQVDRTTTLDQIKAWANQAKSDKQWLILMYHHIDNTSSDYGSSPELLNQALDYVNNLGIRTTTVQEGVEVIINENQAN